MIKLIQAVYDRSVNEMLPVFTTTVDNIQVARRWLKKQTEPACIMDLEQDVVEFNYEYEYALLEVEI